MKRIDLTDEQLEWARQTLNKNAFTEIQIGDMFKAKWPDVFAENTLGRNVTYRLKQKLLDAGIDIVYQRMGPRRVDPPNTRWLDANPPLEVQYHPRVGIFGDIHAGSHDPDVVEFVAEKVEERSIDVLVWAGDIFDNAYVGHKGNHSAYASPLDEVTYAAAQIFDRMSAAGVKTHYLYQGNHDNKPARGTQGEWSFEHFLQENLFPNVKLDGLQIRTTNRYYMTMRPRKPKSWPFEGPQNFGWRFTHQKEYSRIPLRTASRLATKLFMNVVCNHQHHLGATKHESGLVWIVDSGCAQLRGATEYKDMRDTTHPEHINGFVTIEDGMPIPHHFRG